LHFLTRAQQRSNGPSLGDAVLVVSALSRRSVSPWASMKHEPPRRGRHAYGVTLLKRITPLASITMLAGVTSCGGGGATSPPPAPSAIAQVSGSSQTGTVGQALPQPLVVKVTAASGAGVSGVSVILAVTAGGGHLSATSVSTDAQGVASVVWTLGTKPGTKNDTTTAGVSGLAGSPVIFVASANVGSASQIASSSGNGQTAPAGTALPAPLSVQVGDAYGNPVSGITVSWAVVSGAGSLSAPTSQAGADGVATVQLTLGREPGSQAASATAPGLGGSPVTFSANATPNGTISGTVTLATGFLAPPITGTLMAVAGTSPSSPPRGSVASALPRPSGRALVLQPLFSPFRAQPQVPSFASPVPIGLFRPSYTPNDLIVTFRPTALNAPPVGSAALASLSTAQAVGSAMRAHLAGILPAGAEVAGASPSILAARIRVADSTRLDGVAAALLRDPAVATVTRNRIVWLDATESSTLTSVAVPNNPLYPLQSWHYDLIDLPRAWSLTTGSASVLVAVVDGGIRFDHPALAANLTSDGYDFVSSTTVPLCGGGTLNLDDDGDSGYDPDPTQPANYAFDPVNNCASVVPIGGHGLHVAGTIGAVGNDGVGVTGANWTVKIRPVRVCGVTGQCNSYDIAQGILYAAGLPADNGSGGTAKPSMGAKIINLSLGSAVSDTNEHLAIVAASNAGALIVAAAGNDASSAPHYPAAYTEVLAVSSVGPNVSLASYSDYGSYVGVAAPGGDIGVGDSSYGVYSALWNFGSSSPTYGAYQGTSQATPHVSGVAALVLGANPSLTAAQLRSRLTTYAVNIGSSNLYGAGLVNAYNSLTQSSGPSGQLYVRLYNATTGAIVQTVAAQAGGSYAFTGLGDGMYDVYAGTDETGDQQIGVPDVGFYARPWGAFGGSALPTSVSVNGAGTYPASFSIGLPKEHDPNNTIPNANVLLIGSYIHGAIINPSTSVPDDVYRVIIAQSGTYTFETSGWIGACGFALEENTILGLYDANGTLLTQNDDIDGMHYNYCSRITTTLNPGTYYVGVAGYYGRRYRLQARSGS